MHFLRRTPPALFPPLLGLFGVGHAWKRASEVFNFQPALGEIILGAASLLLAVLICAYALKIAHRPSVLMDDLKMPPARAAIPAASVCLMLLSLAILPLWPGAASPLLIIAVALHWILALFVILALTQNPVVIPSVLHIPFVGSIVGMIAAVPLGFVALATLVFWVTLAFATVIWIWGILHLSRNALPPPMRPLVTIHLAPIAIFGLVAHGLGYDTLFAVFTWMSAGVALLLAVRAKWLTAAGFSPVWGSLTFPLAAFANLQLLAWHKEFGSVPLILGGLALIVVTVLTFYVIQSVLRDWIGGRLAEKTGAATA